MTSRTGRVQIDLISFNLGGYPVALPASQSLGLAKRSTKALTEAQAHRAWLLQLLHYQEETSPQTRQILMLQGTDGPVPLEIDNQPLLESVAPEHLRPLPKIMAQVSSFKAARGFWLTEQGLRLLLDPTQFPTLADTKRASSSKSHTNVLE